MAFDEEACRCPPQVARQGSDLRPMVFFEEAPNAWGSASPPSCSRPPQSSIIGPCAPKVDIDTPPQFEKRWGTHVDIGAPAQKPWGADPDIELRFPEALGT